MANKKQSALDTGDDPSEGDGLEEYAVEIMELEQAARNGHSRHEKDGKRTRDWRDVEKYHEMLELKRQIEDAYWLDADDALFGKRH